MHHPPLGLEHWPTVVWADYGDAHVRLATVRVEGVLHLLFGCVELLPTEIVPLPAHHAPRLKLPGGATAMVSLTTLPAEDAVRWYESALNGAVSLPGDSGAVRARVGPLSPEPRLGTFVVATTPTVALSLGSQPRMHRMVPREGMPNPVPRLVGTPDEETTLRVWVRETCFVDLATMPDCLGALVLLAPNPLLRGVVDWPVRRTESGGEVIAVRLLKLTRLGGAFLPFAGGLPDASHPRSLLACISSSDG